VTRLAIIGGSGLTRLKNLEITRREVARTPYGELSGPLVYGNICGHEVVFLARHGQGHTIPPHLVNYRANIYALKTAGITHVIAVAAVGAIDRALEPAALVIPDQIIDYTYSREHTFFDEDNRPVTHIDFTYPYCSDMRQVLQDAASELKIALTAGATYAATQGPRFESAAEVDRLERDGAHVVGMTGMPETALAKELGLCYAALAVVANPAAGRGPADISLREIEETLEQGMRKVRTLLERAIPIAAERIL
jgi:5'-methylthioadenosine phosphorylase/5'-methylthioinosine phosphorylase